MCFEVGLSNCVISELGIAICITICFLPDRDFYTFGDLYENMLDLRSEVALAERNGWASAFY
jgi:hypothetical protein